MNLEESTSLNDCLPHMAWGFGHSPGLFDKCHATLAVAWGPLIKLYILKDIMNETASFLAMAK